MTSPAPAATKTPIWEDFIDIFHSPSEVFARRQNQGVLVPMLILTLILGGLNLAFSGVLSPVRDAEFSRAMAAQMKAHPEYTQDQLETGRKIGEVVAKVGAFVLVPIAILVVGLFVWLVGKLVEAKEPISGALVIATYAFVPHILESVLNGVQGLLMDPASLTGAASLSLSAARFMNPETTSPVMMAIAGHFDVFVIWLVVLIVIGLSVIGKIPRSRAAIAGGVLWVIGLLPALLRAVRS
jgi:Yip1 domain.